MSEEPIIIEQKFMDEVKKNLPSVTTKFDEIYAAYYQDPTSTTYSQQQFVLTLGKVIIEAAQLGP
jgi:hypothetical protein